MTTEIRRLLEQFKSSRIAVIGDLMLDEYLWGHIERISPEAPTPIFNLVRKEATLGGAGNVAKNLRMLGAQVTVLGAVGTDPIGQQIANEFDALGIDVTGVKRDAGRQSTCKSRLISIEHGQQVFRFDSESLQEVSGDVEKELLEAAENKIRDADAVLCSDYLKGVLSARVLQGVIAAARRHGVPVIIAPKDSDPRKYRGATILVPNVKELSRLVGSPITSDAELSAAAQRAIGDLQVQALLVTRGAQGMSLFEAESGNFRRIDIPTTAQAVYDVTGAGDTAVSVFTLALSAGADRDFAARLANIAAGIVVSKRGTAWATAEEILAHAQEHDRGEGNPPPKPAGSSGNSVDERPDPRSAATRARN